MPRRVLPFLLPFLLLFAAVYLFGLTRTGLLGPDEPRYAAIGRQMAASGDWVTPRLWGEPWFEKPPLLYWLTAAAFRLGFSEDLAPRLPVALMGVLFLVFFAWIMQGEFGAPAATFATLILGSGVAWMGFSQTAVPDLPMTTAFSAAMLMLLAWIARGERTRLTGGALCLALAVLAKGLVPLVLALPLFWMGRKRLRDLLRPRVMGVFLIVACPWFLLCWLRNGNAFFTILFLQHHLQRFVSPALQHVQPFWFFAPVLLLALFPWTALLLLLFRRTLYSDPRCVFLLLWVIFGFVFFSASANKLPGYILPLLPPLAALMGIALAQKTDTRRTALLLALCALPLLLVPAAAQTLPDAIAFGLSRAPLPHFQWIWLLFALPFPAVWYLASSGKRLAAAGVVAAAMAGSVVWIKLATLPLVDREASARPLWRQIAGVRDRVCVDPIGRNWRYGLNYYSSTPLPDCSESPKPVRITQDIPAGSLDRVPPYVVRSHRNP